MDFIGYNLYAYVSNMIIHGSDSEGKFINFKTIKKHIGKAIKIVTTVVSSTIGMIIGAPVSASMLNKSMNNPNAKINKITKNKLANKIENSKEMEDVISACLEKYKNNHIIFCTGSIEFTSNRDLEYSVGKANYSINGRYNYVTNTKFLEVNVSDTYDFGEGDYPPKSIKDAANYFGSTYENYGLLKNYNWDITYFTFYK